MRDRLEALIQEQRRTGFPDLAGAAVSATIPISDRLLNQLIAGVLPPDGAVGALSLQARNGNELVLDLRVARGGLTLPVRLVLAIDAQPELPHRPVLVLRLKTAPLLFSLGGPVIKMLGVLPPGVSTDGDRIHLDLQRLSADRGGAEAWRHLTELRVTTIEGAVLLAIRGGIAAAAPGR